MKNGNTSNRITNKDNASDNWIKPKNSRSRACKLSADDVSYIGLSNKFSILDVDQQSQGLLEHEGMKVKSLKGKSKVRRKKVLLLGSSHGQDIGPMLQEHLGTEYEVTSIIKLNAPLENVVEDLENLGKDHIVIVGGPGNSLDRNFKY